MHVSAERRSLHGVINPFASTNILERALNCPLSPRARVYATNRGKSPHRVSRRRTRFRKLPTKFVSKFEVVKESRRERERETFFFFFNTFNAHIRFTTRTIALKFYGEMEKKKEKEFFTSVVVNIWRSHFESRSVFLVLLKKWNEWFWGISREMCCANINLKNLLFFINREMDEIEIDNVNFERNRLLYKRSREVV